MKSTKNVYVVEIEPGLYRVARRGGRSALTGKFLLKPLDRQATGPVE